MHEVLLIPREDADAVRIRELLVSKGVRFEETNDIQRALDQIDLKKIEGVFFHHNLSVRDQELLAGKLWQRNPGARFVMYDLDERSSLSNFEVRLSGAEIARGKNAIEEIEKILDAIKLRVTEKESEFRIMVVEDLDSPREIICYYVQSLGFPSVEGVRSAQEAIHELEKGPEKFSCIISDQRMPNMTGEELVQHIRSSEKLKHLPVIMLTAHGTVDTLVGCLKAGASGFLVKPPKKSDLTRELSRAIRIVEGNSNPRLASEEEAEELREVLEGKGL